MQSRNFSLVNTAPDRRLECRRVGEVSHGGGTEKGEAAGDTPALLGSDNRITVFHVPDRNFVALIGLMK